MKLAQEIINIILKADVSGSLEALSGIIGGFQDEHTDHREVWTNDRSDPVFLRLLRCFEIREWKKILHIAY